jgi:hypothetical protein
MVLDFISAIVREHKRDVLEVVYCQDWRLCLKAFLYFFKEIDKMGIAIRTFGEWRGRLLY